jgi:twinkle protein
MMQRQVRIFFARKVRTILSANGNPVEKAFSTIGKRDDWKRVGLFGQSAPFSRSRYLTITEGEVDAMSAFQMMGSKFPCVSLIQGAQSTRKMLENPEIYAYLDSFENIVICFDMDEEGRKATEVLCEVFPHKAKIMQMQLKDANEYLLQNMTKDFVDCFWSAKKYQPDGLALSSSFIQDAVDGSVARGAIPYPYKELNRKLFGMRQGELTTWVAGTGSGKSTIIRELVAYIKQSTPSDERIGMLMLEEAPNKTTTGLVGLQMSKPLLLWDLDKQLPENERMLKHLNITKEQRLKAAQEILGDDRFVIMQNSFQGTDLDNIIKKVRQMSKVYGCKHVVLDHISIIVSGQDQGDERKALDAITTRLRHLVEETGINLHVVSHLKRPSGSDGHESGAEISLAEIRGTAAIAQLSDNVIGLERNQQHDDAFLRNVISLRVLKCRITGLTGQAGYVYYNHDTGRVEPLDTREYDAKLKAYMDMKKGIDQPQKAAFSPNEFDFNLPQEQV